MNFEVFIHKHIGGLPDMKFLIIYENNKQDIKKMYWGLNTGEWVLVINQPYWFREFLWYPDRFKKVKLTKEENVEIFSLFL